MNVVTWMLAGTVIGWIGFSHLRFNPKRGLVVSIIIGIAGGLLGGAWLTPLIETVSIHAEDFNLLAFFAASAVALAALTTADMVYRRFGV